MRFAALVLLAASLQAQPVCRESLTTYYCRDANGFWSAAAKPPLSYTPYQSGSSAAALQTAKVFDPNPVAAINDPNLRDENDSASAVPEHAYTLTHLDPAHARIVDRQLPNTPLPDLNAPLLFNREDDRFEPVNALFHIDKIQRILQSYGYFGSRQLVPYAIEVDANALNGVDASLFLPSLQTGRGTLYFGTGGTDDAEDGDIVVHEYGHAILEWVAPGTFGAGTFSSEARAMAEGFGDYLAFSTHYETRVASGRDPFCYADWDARCWTDAASEGCAYPVGADCLRRLDSPRTMADYSRGDTSGVEHRNGQIWSSALREIFLAAGRNVTDVLVLESLFATPPNPTFAIMARRLIETDRLLYGGVHANLICAAMTRRGIAVSCDGTPRGELLHFPSRDAGLAIPELNPFGITSTIEVSDPRIIQKLAVRIDIDHTARGDLRIELEAPDGTRVLLQNVSADIAPDIHVTFGIDAASAQSLDRFRGLAAAGTWRLHVSDQRARDTGTLEGWSLVFQFDDPRAERPRAAKSQLIPVVAHLFGVGITPYVSDVHLANVTASPQTATLIFTRSHADGARDFSAIDVQLAAGQSLTFEDLVSRAFFTTGSGSLEILGDVLVRSRLHNGSVGQEVPPVQPSTRFALAGFPDPAARFQLGLAEATGVRTRVTVDGLELTLEPFSHVQIPSDRTATVTADTPVVAYLSQLDPAGGDAMFLTAPTAGLGLGINTAQWRTEYWNATTVVDAVTVFGTRSAASFAEGWTRIVSGRTTQVITPRPLDDRREQHLIGLSNDARHRTNIGIVTDGFALAEVVVFDAAGTEVERHVLFTVTGIAQIGVTAKVTGGRAVVRTTGDRARAYASVIDLSSGDASFVDGR